MGEVVGPHDIILAPPLQIVAADRIVEEAGIDLIAKVLAGILAEWGWISVAEAAVIVIPLLRDPGQPTRFVFYGNNLEPGIALQHAIENQLEKRVGDVHQLQIDAAAVTLDTVAVLVFVVAVARQDVQADRRLEILSSSPKFIIMAGMERQIGMGRLPNDRPFQPRLAATFELFNAIVDVIDRDGRDADQSVGIDAAIID